MHNVHLSGRCVHPPELTEWAILPFRPLLRRITTAGQDALTQHADSGINDDNYRKLYRMILVCTWDGEDVNSRLDLRARGSLYVTLLMHIEVKHELVHKHPSNSTR